MAEPAPAPGPRRAEAVGFTVVHHLDGPRVRLSVAWFTVAVVAALADHRLLALVMAVTAAVAADELLRVHRHPSRADDPASRVDRAQRFLGQPDRVAAAVAAAWIPLAASGGADALTAAVAGATVVLLVGALFGGGLVDVGLPMVAALPLGLAAASPVLLAHLGSGAAVALLVLVAAYDAGDFIVGTGASSAWEGPAAGITAVAVLGFAAVVIAQPPLEEDGSATLAVLVAVLAPLGPPLASVLIGDGMRRASATRRLDSLLLVGPLAAYAMAGLLPSL